MVSVMYVLRDCKAMNRFQWDRMKVLKANFPHYMRRLTAWVCVFNILVNLTKLEMVVKENNIVAEIILQPKWKKKHSSFLSWAD